VELDSIDKRVLLDRPCVRGTMAQRLAVAPRRAVVESVQLRDAQEYLGTQAFSLKGLISQLKYDGFTTSQANYGAHHVRVNWNKEAAADARDYLQTQAFSRSGLIAQLEYDGFTPSQAAYGANAVHI
jgi:hypothetical protein